MNKDEIKEKFEKYRLRVGIFLILGIFLWVVIEGNRAPAVKKEAELGEKKEVKVGDVGLKRYNGDDLRVVVLAVSEYDEKGNIIHKKTGKYNGTLGLRLNPYNEDWAMVVEKYEPFLTGILDIYYEHEYDKKGNVIHTTVNNSKDDSAYKYFFEYDESGKVVKSRTIECKTGEEKDFSYEYDSSGNMMHAKLHYVEKKFNVSIFDGDIYFKHENEDDGFVNSKIKSKISILNKRGTLINSISSDEELGITRKLCMEKSDIPIKPCSEARLFLNYRAGENVKTEYYRVYTEKGYVHYFGDSEHPVRINGKACFNESNVYNRAKRTLIDYYLRSDGTVEKSIEYTGFREVVVDYKTTTGYSARRTYQRRTDIPAIWR